jgi:hypothetical protein
MSHEDFQRDLRNPPDGPSPVSLRDMVADALRYWEIRRVGYNIVLTLIALGWLYFTWPHFRPAFHWESALKLLVLAVLANVCYCAAYPVDLAIQCSPSRDTWRRRRWVLWCAGTLFAACFEYYWIADEIYPFVV